MTLAEKVAEIKKADSPVEQHDQVKRYREELARMESQGFKRHEQEDYRIPLDQRMAMACMNKQ